jgi:hypothetical protein
MCSTECEDILITDLPLLPIETFYEKMGKDLVPVVLELAENVPYAVQTMAVQFLNSIVTNNGSRPPQQLGFIDTNHLVFAEDAKLKICNNNGIPLLSQFLSAPHEKLSSAAANLICELAYNGILN